MEISAEGKHLGTIITPKHPHNFAWGDADGKTLHLCARSGLYRMRLSVPGVRPWRLHSLLRRLVAWRSDFRF